jgi:hypothetical protein
VDVGGLDWWIGGSPTWARVGWLGGSVGRWVACDRLRGSGRCRCGSARSVGQWVGGSPAIAKSPSNENRLQRLEGRIPQTPLLSWLLGHSRRGEVSDIGW